MTAHEARKIAAEYLSDPRAPTHAALFAPYAADALSARLKRGDASVRGTIPSPTPLLDAEVILAAILGVSRSHLAAHPETPLETREEDYFRGIALRATGYPVAYVTGTKEFWGLPFAVTPAVLIPKPDTETLVALAEDRIRALLAETAGRAISVLDVCTGSGCVAVSLKHDFPALAVTATDISPAALEVARANARALLPKGGFSPVAFFEGDLRQGLPESPGGWDLVVSNPPYVPDAVAHDLLADGRGEPLLALAGGTDGLDLVRALARGARGALRAGGILLVETGEYNAQEAAASFRAEGFARVTVHRDLEGQDRVVEGTAL
jgi:release factor glutamine methyltransferase